MAPFRPLGVMVAEVLRGGQDSSPPGSPSGLLTRRAWEAELACAHGRVPDWHPSGIEGDRQFARWVHTEAKILASRLERLLGADAEPELARHVRAVAAALWSDADWARRRLDGSLED